MAAWLSTLAVPPSDRFRGPGRSISMLAGSAVASYPDGCESKRHRRIERACGPDRLAGRRTHPPTDRRSRPTRPCILAAQAARLRRAVNHRPQRCQNPPTSVSPIVRIQTTFAQAVGVNRRVGDSRGTSRRSRGSSSAAVRRGSASRFAGFRSGADHLSLSPHYVVCRDRCDTSCFLPGSLRRTGCGRPGTSSGRTSNTRSRRRYTGRDSRNSTTRHNLGRMPSIRCKAWHYSDCSSSVHPHPGNHRTRRKVRHSSRQLHESAAAP